MLREWAIETTALIKGDASAALGIISRRGTRKRRPLETSHLWIQAAAAEKRASYTKVSGTESPADALTKELPALRMSKYSHQLGMKEKKGRADKAPELHVVRPKAGY